MQELTKIADLTREQLDDDLLILTMRELVGKQPYRLNEAFRRVRKECKFFPRPVEILERVPIRFHQPGEPFYGIGEEPQ